MKRESIVIAKQIENYKPLRYIIINKKKLKNKKSLSKLSKIIKYIIS
jgi:hypothetical protein